MLDDQISEDCRKHNFWSNSDEVYSPLARSSYQGFQSAHKVKFSHLFSVILTYLLDIFHYVTKLKNLELLKYFVAYVKNPVKPVRPVKPTLNTGLCTSNPLHLRNKDKKEQN